MVASRHPWRLDFLAAAIKRSISAVVRYSRVRTEEFTVVGGDRPPLRFSTIFCPRSKITSELSGFSLSSVNRKCQSEQACKAALPDSRACSVMLKVVLALFG